MRREFLGLAVVLTLAASGCEEVSPPQNAQPPVVVQPAAPPQRIAAPDTTIAEGSADRPVAGAVREKARRGMGKKGQGYGGGIITQPISTYFQTRDRIALQQIIHEMKIYKAMNGHYPKNLDEFMDKIIKPARIKLPTLPEGQRYIYDPKKGELLVERPR